VFSVAGQVFSVAGQVFSVAGLLLRQGLVSAGQGRLRQQAASSAGAKSGCSDWKLVGRIQDTVGSLSLPASKQTQRANAWTRQV